MKTWIKGGLIGLVVFLLIFSVLFTLDYRCTAPLLKICPNEYSITGNESDLFETVDCVSNAFDSCKPLSDIVYYFGIFPFIYLIKITGFDIVSFGTTTWSSAIIYDIFIILNVIITGFLLGALVGFVVGKFRNRNKKF